MEIWKDIKGYEGYYKISNKGRIKSLHFKHDKILKPYTTRFGHKRIGLKKGNLKKKHFRVHRLIAEAFIPNPENKPFVLHKDDVPDNNDINNLYWGDAQDNANDKCKNGGVLTGERHPFFNKKRPEFAKKMRGRNNPVSKPVRCLETGKEYVNARRASEDTGYHFGTVSDHCLGKYKKQKFKFV